MVSRQRHTRGIRCAGCGADLLAAADTVGLDRAPGVTVSRDARKGVVVADRGKRNSRHDCPTPPAPGRPWVRLTVEQPDGTTIDGWAFGDVECTFDEVNR